MSFLQSDRPPRWLIALVPAHVGLLIVGFATEAWLLTAFCVWVRPEFIQVILQMIWLVLTLSPGLGIGSLATPAMRKPYLVTVVATPLFFLFVMALNATGTFECNAL